MNFFSENKALTLHIRWSRMVRHALAAWWLEDERHWLEVEHYWHMKSFSDFPVG